MKINRTEEILTSSSTISLYPSLYNEGEYVIFEEFNADKKKKIKVKIADRISVDSILSNIDTKEISLKLRFLYKGKEHELVVSRDKCQIRREILQLTKFGVGVNESNAGQIICHINNEERKAEKELIHSKLGFSMYDGDLVFKHYEAIGIKSKYCGSLEIKPKGSLKASLRLIKKHVSGNTPLEVMLTAGLSSAIVGMLGLDTLIVHVSGNSTTGKTTGANLAVSPWGYPSITASGLFSNWNATSNAIVSNFNGNYGLAVALDEISMANAEDFTKLIYRFAGGRDKSRLNKDSTLKEVGTWATTLISNGEFSILSKSKHNIGLKMRVIELKNISFTKDASSADEIKEVCKNNYGHLGKKYAGKLLELGKDEVQQIYNSTSAEIFEKFKEEGIEDSFSSRRSDKYAILIATAKIANSELELGLNIEAIMGFIVECEIASLKERDLEKNAYEYFIEQYSTNEKKFAKDYSSNNIEQLDVIPSGGFEVWGRFVKNKGIRKKKPDEICIYPEIFKKLMKAGGFEDINIVLNDWKNSGILDAESDRYTRKRKMTPSAPPVTVYVIKLIEEEEVDNKELSDDNNIIAKQVDRFYKQTSRG